MGVLLQQECDNGSRPYSHAHPEICTGRLRRRCGAWPDNWDTGDFENLMKGLSAHFGKSNLAVSTFANLTRHPDALPAMSVAEPYVCMYAPQIYWFDNDPAAYARTSLNSWRAAGIAKP